MRSLVLQRRPLLAAGFGLVCLAGAAAAYLAVRAAEAEHMVAHTLEVQGIATQLLSDLKDAETGQRGFLLTHAPAYLEPFKRAETGFPGALASLTRLTSDNARQQDRLTQLEPLIDAKLEELRRTIALAEEGQQDKAVDIVRSDRGRELMDRIRGYVLSISQEERDLLVLREADASNIRRWLLGLIGVTLAAAVVLAGFLTQAMQRALERLRERTKELEAEEKLRRETEETLRQAQKLEAIGQLTSGIAHDFNNLLTVITGNLEILQRRLRNMPPSQDSAVVAATVGKPIDMALKGAASAAKLTHRLLAFSRRQMLNPVRLDLNRVVLDMSDLLRRTLGEAISIETALAAGLWPTFADSNQIENTLLNLCINARDAMREGGRLTIETANAHLDEAYARQFGDVTPGQYVLLSVTDTGTGITSSDLPRIFEPFFTTKPKGEGTGLGLAMVHGFVKQTGGHIRVYSEVGHGTTVKIYLPRLVAAELPATPAARTTEVSSIQAAAAGETILVVEDNDGVRSYARSALEELGYRVLAAADVPDALRQLDGTHRVDLLFTDVILPSGTGREVADEAARLRPGLPVLFTTGYTRNSIVHNGRLDSAVELLTKPYSQQALARKIRELLDRAQA